VSQYVIKAFDKYFIRDAGNCLDEIYDLYQATIYESVQDAKKVFASCTYSEYFKIEEYDSVKKEFDEWKAGGMVRRKLSKIDKEMSRKYNGEPLEEVIKFFIYHHANEDKVRQKDYSTWPDLYLLSKILMGTESYSDRDYTNSWITFKISVKKDVSFTDFKQDIDLALKYTTFKKNGFYIFHIMDHELSRYECRYLHIHESEDRAQIVNHRERIKFDGSIEECFKEIKEQYYYDE
jgi:hypothetical protein